MLLSYGKKIFGNKFPQVVAVITATFGAISDGVQYGWAAPVIPILQKEDSPVGPIDSTVILWLEVLYMFGGVAGLPLTIYMVDRYGRKKSILIAAAGNFLSWVLTATAYNTPMLYASRFIAGMAGDMAFVAGPMYIAEIADKDIRGLLSGFIYIALLLGIVVIYCVAPFVSIVVSSMVGASFVVLQFLTFIFMPESPYYLLMDKKTEKCKKTLQFLRGTKEIEEEYQEIAAAVTRQEQEKGRPIDLIMDKGNRKGVIIMTVLNGSQHFSSISVMLMNLHLILSGAEGIISTEMSGIVFSVVMLFAAMFGVAVVDRYGRKKLLAVSSFLTGISLALLATYFLVKNVYKVDVTEYNWIPLFSIILYAVAFKCGLGIVPIVMTGELFPTSVKAMGMATADAMYVIFGTLSIFMYQELEQRVGIYCPFYIFAASCLLTAMFAIFYIPETNGKTLEEIQFILKGLTPEEIKKRQEQDVATTKL